MGKFLFHYTSKFLLLLEAIGVLGLITLIITWWPGNKSIVTNIFFSILFVIYLLIRFFATFEWYNEDGQKGFSFNKRKKVEGPLNFNYPGIELQFKKALVPTSYILPIFTWLLVIGAPSFLLYIAVILLAIILHVNIILFYFYIRDNGSLPVNHFTHNKHISSL